MWALWIHKRLLVSPRGRQRSRRQYIRFLTFNIQANRVAIVSSVITRIFNPSKYWTVTIQLLLYDTLLFSACIVYRQFLLFDFCLLQCFCSIQCFIPCSAFIWFNSFVQCSNYSVYIFCPDPENVFQVIQSCYTPTIKQSINIIQQTAPSLF